MLLAIDGALGAAATEALVVARRAFAPALRPFVAPLAEPDGGVTAALRARPAAALLASRPTPWLADLGLQAVAHPGDGDVETAISTSLGLTVAEPRRPKAAGLPPLDASALATGLDGIPAWTLEVSAAGGAVAGLRVELVRAVSLSSFAAAADFARAVATLADEQDHHPALIQDWTTVTIRVFTGEAGQRLTERDLRFATAVDRLAADLER
ncbi:MAG: 4a-hydroxytetrahydrobiopterin dehydratase [Pseudomonadota bacterium]